MHYLCFRVRETYPLRKGACERCSEPAGDVGLFHLEVWPAIRQASRLRRLGGRLTFPQTWRVSPERDMASSHWLLVFQSLLKAFAVERRLSSFVWGHVPLAGAALSM